MASTYTTTLQLNKQGTGDNPNTWGTVANLVFDGVDQAANGYLSINVAGSANVTLAWPAGTTSGNQANNAIIQFTGLLTGNIVVFVPATSSKMLYKNATTGPFSLTISVVGAPGATAVVSQGYTASLWTDGTNVYNSLLNVDLLAAHTLTTAGGTTVGGGLTIPAGGLVVVGAANITGGLTVDNLDVTGAATVTGTLVAAAGTSGNQVVNYGQFSPFVLGSTGSAPLPNGSIFKWGTGATTAGAVTISFVAGFPAACDNVQITINGGSGTGTVPVLFVGAYNQAGFLVYGAPATAQSFFWTAIGH